MAKKKNTAKSHTEENLLSNPNFDNPFKGIDKKNFRNDKVTPQEKVKKPTVETHIPSQDFENDEDLFLASLSSHVRTLDNSQKYVQKETAKQSQHIENKEKNQDKKQEKNNFSLTENFSQALKEKEEKRNSSKNIAQDLAQNMAKNFPYKKDNSLKNKEKSKENSTEMQTFPQSEESEFFSALNDVKPLKGKERVAPPEPEKIIVQKNQITLLHDFEDSKLEFSLTANENHIQCNILGLDILTLAQLQERHYNPEAHLDLHGFTAKQAFDALLPFMKNAYFRDMRCVLIVTGRGNNSFDNRALLRTKVTDWLIDSPFKYLVLAFCTAKNEDGGAGALYVLLRKRRKNSPPIPWERIPNDYDLWSDLDK